VTTPPRQSAGRPTHIDRDEIARVAVRLFAERGYDAVSMDTIAQEIGIGRRSLFRYFATKADLVWDGVDPASEELRKRLAGADPDGSPLDTFARAFVGGITSDAVDLRMARTRLQIIASHADLISLGPPRLLENAGAIADFLRGSLPATTDPVQIVAMADALSACCYAALRHWATDNDDETPGETIRRALAGFELLVRA
jgi:AcrR family transcriptional regulator